MVRRAATVYLRDVWPSTRGDRRAPRAARSIRRSTGASTRTSRRQNPLWNEIPAAHGRSALRSGIRPRTYIREPPYFEPLLARTLRARRGRGRARRSPSSATRSPPTTSARPARSSRPRRPAPTSRSLGVAGRGLQQLRRAARQPRGHGARHLRQRAHPEPDGPRRRGRRHRAPARRRADGDLRRGRALPSARACRCSSSPARSTATGSSRDWAAKGTRPCSACARRGRAVLRAHPPLEPGRHGRPALPVPARASRPRRSASTAPRRSTSAASRGGLEAAAGGDARRPPRRRRGRGGAGHRAHRHAHRGRVLPARRHPAVRAARASPTRGADRALDFLPGAPDGVQALAMFHLQGALAYSGLAAALVLSDRLAEPGAGHRLGAGRRARGADPAPPAAAAGGLPPRSASCSGMALAVPALVIWFKATSEGRHHCRRHRRIRRARPAGRLRAAEGVGLPASPTTHQPASLTPIRGDRPGCQDPSSLASSCRTLRRRLAGRQGRLFFPPGGGFDDGREGHGGAGDRQGRCRQARRPQGRSEEGGGALARSGADPPCTTPTATRCSSPSCA